VIFPQAITTHILSFLILQTSPLLGVQDNIRFDLIDQETGLSQTVIKCIVQDKKGYLWFGTQFGLNRYDGYRFETFSLDPEKPGSLDDHYINTMLVDNEGLLWVGTRNGLNRLNSQTELFEQVKPKASDLPFPDSEQVTALFQDGLGLLWVGMKGGLFCYDPKTRSLKKYPLREDPYRFIISAIGEDHEGRLWIGSVRSGVLILDGSDTLSLIHNSSELKSLSSNHITSLLLSDKGDMWVGTRNGLNKVGRDGQIQVFQNDPKQPNSLANNEITALMEDDKGQLWAGTNGGGVAIYEPETRGFYSHGASSGMRNQMVQALYQDRSGVYWVGLYGMALCKYAPSKQQFSSFSSFGVWSILEDGNGILWAGLVEAGLAELNPSMLQSNRYLNDPKNPDSLSQNNVISLAQPKGWPEKIWVGTSQGLNLFDKEKKTFEHITPQIGRFSQTTVKSLYLDDGDKLWIGSSFGLNYYDPETGEANYWIPNPSNPEALLGSVVYFSREDSKGRFWVGTDQGLNRFDLQEEVFHQIRHDPKDSNSLSHESLVSFCEQRNGNLWFGTFNGLNLMNSDQSFTRYMKKDGLADNPVLGLLEDAHGDLWVSTIRGLSRMRFRDRDGSLLEKPVFNNYFKKDGLPNDEFNVGGYHKGRDGVLYFGNVSGLVAISPQGFVSNPIPPEILITDFQLFNERVKPGPDSPLSRPISDTDAITLDHTHDNLTFEFAGIHYTAPDKNRYAYKMEGFDDNWYYTGSDRRRATYTNLGPGDYEFKVKAANADGVWNEKGTSVAVHILPAPWRTWWAFTFYGVICLTAVFGAIRFAAFREKEKARLNETLLRARAAEAQALAMEAENRRKSAELEEARALQLSMLPHAMPHCSFLNISAGMRTATEVGGDYYDFQALEDGSLILAIGDATGHGMRAGAMVSIIKTLFKSRVDQLSFTSFFEEATRTIKKMNMGNLYMALSLARVSARKVSLSAAGMPPVLHFNKKTGKTVPILIKGLPLGGVSNYPYREVEISWEPGDLLLFMSDGLEERFNPQDQMLGMERIMAALKQNASLEPDALLDVLRQLGDQWADSRPSDDDETMVILRYQV